MASAYETDKYTCALYMPRAQWEVLCHVLHPAQRERRLYSERRDKGLWSRGERSAAVRGFVRGSSEAEGPATRRSRADDDDDGVEILPLDELPQQRPRRSSRRRGA